MSPAELALNGIIIAIAVGWIGWVSISMVAEKNKNTELKIAITTLIDKVDTMGQRLDMFLKNELDALKDIVSKK